MMGKRNQKLLIILLVFILLFFLAACNRVSELDAVYESEYYSVRYDSDWEKDDMEHLGILEAVTFYVEDNLEEFSIGIVVEDNVTVESGEYLSPEQLKMMLPGFELKEKDSFVLDNQEGERIAYFSNINEGNIIFHQVAVVKDGLGYTLTFSVEENNEEQFYPLFKELLNSFSFK